MPNNKILFETSTVVLFSTAINCYFMYFVYKNQEDTARTLDRQSSILRDVKHNIENINKNQKSKTF